MNDLQPSIRRLEECWQRLSGDFDRARGSWKDVVSDKFEQEFIRERETVIRRSLDSLQALADALDQLEDEV